MQVGIQFERIAKRAPRKPGDMQNETLRLTRRHNRSAAQNVRRQARRIANIVKGRA